MLLGFIYWQTATEMTRRVDMILALEEARFSQVTPDNLSDEIDKSVERDQRHVYFYGLFTSDGRLTAGNIPRLPTGMPVDGQIHGTTLSATNLASQSLPARAMAIRQGSGSILVIGHDVQQFTEFGEVMRSAFFWGGSLTILLGLVFGLLLSFGPLRRVEQIQQVCELIMRGNMKQRLPVSGRHDELDMLAVIVNKVLDEVDRLMSEVKSVGDNIAHDLRTPLTRLRALLYRMKQQLGDASPHHAMMGQVIAEVDSLLLRFRALLRISEIENKQRRAGFKSIQLPEILAQAVNFLEPLAENKSIRLSMVAESVDPINGDGELLFEVFVNVLDNAIKFTPEGGHVEVRLARGPKGAQVDIVDSGAGIRANEKTAVLNRFYRGENDLQAPGFGLGLSIVMAIIRLHDFGFRLEDADPGTRATIYCWPQGV